MRGFIGAFLVSAMLAGCLGSDDTAHDLPPTQTAVDAGGEGADAPDAVAFRHGLDIDLFTVQGDRATYGDPADADIRPGVTTTFSGAQCTSNFLYTDGSSLYIGSAAHCVASGSSSDTNGCTAPTVPLGSTVNVRHVGSGSTQATLAYSSWNAMQAAGESGAACGGNDFALLKLPASASAHPAALHFGGPTGLAGSGTTQVWGYGASSLKLGIDPLHPKEGVRLGSANGGWSHFVYLVTPGIPGDSGGFIFDSGGRALGVASTIIIAPYPAANHYADIAAALAYAASHGGPVVSLVTWDDWTPSLL